MPIPSVAGCCEAIAEKGWKIAFVENATSGRMCAEFALIPCSRDILQGGLFCCNAFIKENLLKLPKWVTTKYPEDSAEATESLAIHAAALFQADITVAVTGLTACGTDESPEKPVGTMFIHVMFPATGFTHSEVFFGDQEDIILASIEKTASMITAALKIAS